MRLFRPSARQLGQAGDTIIEVMVSMTVLGLIMSVAFVTSRHSLQQGLDASYRDQAESYAQQQVELIKELDASNKLDASYQSTAFCINPATEAAISATNGPCSLPVGGTASQYTVVDKYDSSLKEYTVQVQWTSTDTAVPNNVSLEYKPHNSFIDTQGAFAPPTATVTTPLTGPWPQFSSDWSGTGGANNPTVPYGYSSLHLTWTTVPAAQSCNGTSSVPDPGWDGVQLINGSYAVPAITTNDSYTLTCTPFNGGTPSSSTITVTVSAPSPPTVNVATGASAVTQTTATLNGGVNPNGVQLTSCYFVYYNPSTGAYVGVTNISPTCSFSGSSAVGVSASITGLDAGTTYYYELCSSNAGGISAGPPNTPGYQCSPTAGFGTGSGWQSFTTQDMVQPPPSSPPLVFSWTFDGGSTWSSAGPQPYCTQILEPSDPNTWDDNYLCSNQNLGLCWTYYGVPGACSEGLACISWDEPSSDPDYTWGDNYLCVPPGSGYNFAWSYAGPISGMDCVLTNEPSEPADQTWDDNYWCWSSD